MALAPHDDTERVFLDHLLEQTGADPGGTVSMYLVGDIMGVERREASRMAEDLMAKGWVEVRSLSGGIALSAEALEALRPALAGESPVDAAPKLGRAVVLDPPAGDALKSVLDAIKEEAGSLNLAFDPLTELMTDLRTIECQLGSPRPKTAVIRACCESLQALLSAAPQAGSLSALRYLLSD